MSQLALVNDPDPKMPDGVDLRLADVDDVLADCGPVDMVHADPPWTYSNTGTEGAADGHYALLDVDDIARQVDDAWMGAADDSYLLLWCTWPLLGEWMLKSPAIRWRFVSGGCWSKTGRLGVGFHWRGDSEPLLLYVKGSPKPFRKATSNTHAGPRTRHSEKPAAWLADLVDTFCPPGGLVLDMYAGLAPLADACVARGRRYLGAEIDESRHRQACGLIATGQRRALIPARPSTTRIRTENPS